LQFPPVSQCSVPPMEFLYSPPKLLYVIINDEADVQASVISIENIIEDEYGSVFIVGHSYHNESAYFVQPCNSDEVLSIKSVSVPFAFSSKWPIQMIKKNNCDPNIS
jgi:hypothetical protein